MQGTEYQSLNIGTNTGRSNFKFLVLSDTAQQTCCWKTLLFGNEDEGNIVPLEVQEFRSRRDHSVPRDRDLLHGTGKTWVMSGE